MNKWFYLGLASLLFAGSLSLNAATISSAGGLSIQEDPAWFRFGGHVQLDGTLFFGDFNSKRAEYANNLNFRRVRIELKGSPLEHFQYNVSFNLVGTLLYNAYLTYEGFGDNLSFSVGQRTPDFGLEDVTSPNHTPFLELAMDGSMHTPQALGLFMNHRHGDWMVQAGVFAPENRTVTQALPGSADPWGVTVRGIYHHLWDQNVFHAGINGYHQHVHQTTAAGVPASLVSFGTGPESVGRSNANIVATPDMQSDHYWMYGPEVLFLHGPFEVEGEYLHMDVNRTHNPSVNFKGWHVTAGYVITGEQRAYDMKEGALQGINPEHGCGAVELVARYSELNLNNKDILGGKANNYGVGFNWYLHKNLRVIGNYIHSVAKERAGFPSRNLDIVAARLQYVWG